MSGTDAWAFLVARGRHKGHRTILVPDFLAESGVPGLLSESVSGAAESQTVTTPAGVVTVLSRTYQLTSRDVDGVVADEYGRPLELLYGFVCRAGGTREVYEDDFTEALDQSLHAYRRFLADENRPFEQSIAFPMRTIPSYAAAPPERPSPEQPTSGNTSGAQRQPRRRMTATAAAVFAVVVVIAVLAVVRPGGKGPVTSVVVIATPPLGEVDCLRPVPIRIHVEITTNAPAAVQWFAEAGGKPSMQHMMSFDRAGTQEGDGDVRVEKPQPGGGVITVSTDSRNSPQGSAEYVLRCARYSE